MQTLIQWLEAPKILVPNGGPACVSIPRFKVLFTGESSLEPQELRRQPREVDIALKSAGKAKGSPVETLMVPSPWPSVPPECPLFLGYRTAIASMCYFYGSAGVLPQHGMARQNRL